ncbi:MAG: tetratricopeptide repeat protein [Calditrichia bacterium]
MVYYLSEIEYYTALRNYVQTLLTEYAQEALPQERYLISLMRLVNRELENRITNRELAQKEYFNELQNYLRELNQLEARLKAANISELKDFTGELKARIQNTIRSGDVDYKKKKVFEDALQLLYVAEEMIKLDKSSSPEKVEKNISRSKKQLLHAFGEVDNLEDVKLDVEPTLFNLFNEWRRTQRVKYEARLLDVKVTRKKLINSGSRQEILRMFNEQLAMAYNQFNFGEYNQADKLLADLTTTYRDAGIREFEDVYFYRGESNFALNRFMLANDLFSKLLEEYPDSRYLAPVYERLIQINYKLENYAKAVDYFNAYRSVAGAATPGFYEMQFVAGLSLYHDEKYNEAEQLLSTIVPASPYYFFARYISGSIYASAQNYERASRILNNLIALEEVPADIYNRSLYKLALMAYEEGNYPGSIDYLNRIPASFSRYDEVLNVLAWSSFKYQQIQHESAETPDYTRAKLYAHELLDTYYASEHRMEAESLLGYIYQLENNPDFATQLYEDVYDSKLKKDDVLLFLRERDELEDLYVKARNTAERALQESKKQAYLRASDIAYNLEEEIWQMEMAEMNSTASPVSREIVNILDQLSQLQELKDEFKAAGNTRGILRVDSMQMRLTSVLERYPQDELRNALAYNWFAAYPVARRVAEYEFRKEKNQELQNEINEEISSLNDSVERLKTAIARQKQAGDFDDVAMAEHRMNRLQDLRKEYDGLYAAAKDLYAGRPYEEFNHWGDFGAFGLIDVNFSERDRLQNRLADVSSLHSSVVDVIQSRRDVVEDKIKKIEGEIRFMTMKVRLTERQRMRAERERTFKESFFDERTSEFQE